MDTNDIKTLSKVLAFNGRRDLSLLLEGSTSEVIQSGQFGSVWNSILSTFIIFSPVEKYFSLKRLGEVEKKSLEGAINDLYPVTEGKPEINSIEFRLLKEDDGQVSQREVTTYVGRTVRVFVSYSTEDKVLAGKIKDGLNAYGLDTFLAHEDIDPASEWQEAILDNLESTDVFLPILTDNFPNSKWTDQESGIAFTREKLIVPISVSGNHPYDFLGRYQSLEVDPGKQTIDCAEIIKAIINKKPVYETQILDSLIKAFATSSSFADAGRKSSLLLIFNEMTKNQVNEIFRAALQNSQIDGSYKGKKNLWTLFDKYQHVIEENLLKELHTVGFHSQEAKAEKSPS